MKRNIFKPFMLLVLVVATIAVLLSADKPKEYTIKLNNNQIVLLYNTLGFAKTAMMTSRTPAVEVYDASTAIDSLQSTIKAQYLAQVDTAKKKSDTLTKKK